MKPKQQKLDSTKIIVSNRWYRERVRVKRMLHELGRRMEEMRVEREQLGVDGLDKKEIA